MRPISLYNDNGIIQVFLNDQFISSITAQSGKPVPFELDARGADCKIKYIAAAKTILPQMCERFETDDFTKWTVSHGRWSTAVDPLTSRYFAAKPIGPRGKCLASAGKPYWRNYSATADIRIPRSGKVGIFSYFQDSSNYYHLSYDPDSGTIGFGKRISGNEINLDGIKMRLAAHEWYRFTIQRNNDTLWAGINQDNPLRVVDGDLRYGKIALFADVRSTAVDEHVDFDDVFVNYLSDKKERNSDTLAYSFDTKEQITTDFTDWYSDTCSCNSYDMGFLLAFNEETKDFRGLIHKNTFSDLDMTVFMGNPSFGDTNLRIMDTGFAMVAGYAKSPQQPLDGCYFKIGHGTIALINNGMVISSKNAPTHIVDSVRIQIGRREKTLTLGTKTYSFKENGVAVSGHPMVGFTGPHMGRKIQLDRIVMRKTGMQPLSQTASR